MKNKGHKAVKRILLVVIAVCLIQIGREYYLSMRHKTQQDMLKEMTEILTEQVVECDDTKKQSAITAVTDSPAEQQNNVKVQADDEPVMLNKYESLYQENQDLIGWLSIEGMNIDYPVMQCEDDEYYLHHDFYGNEDKYGCLYVRNRADVEDGTNFIIYGHNMRDGSMFGDLDLYLDENFYPEHSLISFDTLYEERTYEIISVFRSQIYNSNDDVFKYYQFYETDTEEEFDYFYKNIKELSIYDTGVEAEFGDTFLILSTCAYHVEDGRLAVAAKRCR